jgi:hypothetical protein
MHLDKVAAAFGGKNFCILAKQILMFRKFRHYIFGLFIRSNCVPPKRTVHKKVG